MKSSKKKEKIRNRRRKNYELAQSPFYKLERKKDLAKLFRFSRQKLLSLCSERESLYVFRDEPVGGKTRALSIPIGDMRRAHARLFNLLKRINLPDHIRSPRTRSTAWGNALLHSAGEVISSFDIKSFYPSTTEEHVFRFFKYRMQMSDDNARILAKICTVKGTLPVGSPMSPHLACLVHLDLFTDAVEIAQRSGHLISVWVDDITISGPTDRRDIRSAIRVRAQARGLATHKLVRSTKARGAVLTGAFLRDGRLSAANSTHLKIRDLHSDLRKTTDALEKHAIIRRLLAQYYYLKKIAEDAKQPKNILTSRIAHLKRKLKLLDPKLSTTEPKISITENPKWGGDTAIPWAT